MKKRSLNPIIFALLPGLLLISGCLNPAAGDPEADIKAAPGHGLVLVSLAGANVRPALGARTMLPRNPEFTRYELEFTDNAGNALPSTDPAYREPYSFTNNPIQLQLPLNTYYIIAKGYNGDALVAESAATTVNVNGTFIMQDFDLEPVEDAAINGVLSYSLDWVGLSRMPSRAELLIETHPGGVPVTLTQELASAGPGKILLLSQKDAIVKLSASLSLPPGDYGLTMSVTMDEGDSPVSRFDIAQVYSNLSTPAAFLYGGEDLYLSNTSPDSGAAFITSFTFEQIPEATTVIGSQPGADGTRLIMIMVPPETTEATLKTGLTPKVICAPGSEIISPLPARESDGTLKNHYAQGEIDFSVPTLWTARAKNGVTQQYTVIVSKNPVADPSKSITYFFFEGFAAYPGVIDQGAETITLTLPCNIPGTITPTSVSSLTPIISIIGQKVTKEGGFAVGSDNFSSPKKFEVYATSSDSDPREYTVTVNVAANNEAEITHFAIDGYPGVTATITPDAGGGQGLIEATLPYGVSLTNLIPLIQYGGKTLNPASGIMQNFSGPVYYTVTAENDTTKTYKVSLDNAPANTDTGIFDFKIIHLEVLESVSDGIKGAVYDGTTPAKVVIGQNPRADGKIPIVIQVPFNTDERNLVPEITLRGSGSSINPVPNNPVPFGNQSNNQEAIYTVTAQNGTTTQDYVVVVSAGGQYYYVNGLTGDDTNPDYYTGESESRAFKTLAYAVYKASQHASIRKIFVSGTLDDASESTNTTYNNDPGSVIKIDGTNSNKITVTGVGNNAVLKGASNKRVLSVTGEADIVFENLTITGGTTGENGGGVYISGNSKVKFSNCTITKNTARSGGGVFIEDDNPSYDSEFTLMGGSISGNTATGNGAGGSSYVPADIEGGGGVCIKGNALFWLAGGTIADNIATKGAGGGVLVKGTKDHPLGGPPSHDDGFLMGDGIISGNKSYGSTYPQGGGGVYVASGEFSMAGGTITSNTATRQGGGVFVLWNAKFTAFGRSSILGNEGVGSSKGICSRGITELQGDTQTDTAYVWSNNDYEAPANFSFTLAENARVGGLVLAYSANNKNVINIAGPMPGQDRIALLDFEGHLTNGKLAPTDINDWLNKTVLSSGSVDDALIGRFPLNTLVGGSTLYLSDYKLSAAGPIAKLVRK
jgi:hypothetical protein